MILLQAVFEILSDNADILPLTLRQIFYILVSNYRYEKTEQAYGRLIETLNRARRAQMIDMEVIRDDGLREDVPHGWENRDQFSRTAKRMAEEFELKRQEGQPTYLMVWCEAQGMLPQLAAAVAEWHIPVLSSGGFDSVTTKHDVAQRISEHDFVEIFHIGDHDPSGVHLYYSLDEDLRAFVRYYGGELTVSRLAVTPDQVDEMNLPTAPPKRTDRRSFSGMTTQAEAIPPRRLRHIVQNAITSRLDIDAFEAVLAEEKEIRERLTEELGRIWPD